MERKPLRSEMGFSTPDKISVRGYDLPNQLLGKIELGGMAFLEITARMPNSREAEVFNALLVTLVEHGMTPQVIASRLISICSPEAMQASVAVWPAWRGQHVCGRSEQIARVLQTCTGRQGCERRPLTQIARDIVEDYATRKAPDSRHRPSAAQTDPPAHAGAIRDRRRNGYRGRPHRAA